MDGLRRLDWASRPQRKFARQMEAVIAVAEQRWQRLPTDEEIAAALNLPVDVYRRRRAKLHGLNLQRLESIGVGDSGRSEKECPSTVFERSELRRALAAAISRLPKIHQTVLSMYYRDELRPREISRIIGLHASRVSQIKLQALRRLRARLVNFGPLAVGLTAPTDARAQGESDLALRLLVTCVTLRITDRDDLLDPPQGPETPLRRR